MRFLKIVGPITLAWMVVGGSSVRADAPAWMHALSRRVPAEEKVLMANPEYRAAMEHKARFVPGLF